MTRRYTLLALAQPRTPWFSDLGRWAGSGLLAADVVRCASGEEVRAHLGAGRPISAALLDSRHPAADLDLRAELESLGIPVLLVTPTGGEPRSLSPQFQPDDLSALLDAHARELPAVLPSGAGVAGVSPAPRSSAGGGWQVAVTGSGGSGRSVTAMALAQGLAADEHGLVVLADLALDAGLAALHATHELGPGLPELVTAHRHQGLPPSEVVRLLHRPSGRGYQVLLGLRRHEEWAVLRAGAVERALATLRDTAAVLVTDVDADVEGERECGSIDVEERNALARAALPGAHLVLVTMWPRLAGLHAAARVVHRLVRAGVPTERLQPVVIGGPGDPARRALLARDIARLVAPSAVASPVFVPEHRGVERALHDATPLPRRLADALAATARRRLETVATAPPPRVSTHGEAIVPGSLGIATARSA